MKKIGLKLNIHKTKIMASSPITSWQIDGEKVVTVTGFIFFVSKITIDDDCRHEIKRLLLLGKKKVMINLGSILKSKDIILPAKVHIVKAMFFPQWPCMAVSVGPLRRMSAKELIVSNCGVGEDS